MTKESIPEFKIVMIGDAFVGKTSIVNRFWGQQFNSNEEPTIAASYIQIPVKVKSEANEKDAVVNLNIWDTAGTEKFQSLVPLYARTADSLVIVFDVTNPGTFEGAKKWYKKVLEDTGSIPVAVICANKCDLAKDLDFTDYKDWAKQNNIMFYQTSALTGDGVNEVFQDIANNLYAKDNSLVPMSEQMVPNEESKSCC